MGYWFFKRTVSEYKMLKHTKMHAITSFLAQDKSLIASSNTETETLSKVCYEIGSNIKTLRNTNGY